jgi:hypothetical protein
VPPFIAAVITKTVPAVAGELQKMSRTDTLQTA